MMQKEEVFLFSLNDTIFKIPSGCCNLFKLSIYNKLINTKFYKVKSNVSNDVFDSLVKYFIRKETPNINSNNFFEYEELSNEFDVMKQLIQFYQNKVKCTTNLSLINKNQKLRTRLNSVSNDLLKKQKTYEQIIKILIENSQFDTYFKQSSAKHLIYRSCEDENIKKLEILTKKEQNQNGLLFILDRNDKTATLHHNLKATGDVVIPPFIKFKRKTFIVNRIIENAFENSKGVKSIQLPSNSNDILIEKSALSCNSLRKVVLPSNFDNFKAEFFNGSENLTEISFDSKNENFLFYENKFLIGKEDKNNDQYEVLLFARRDIEEAKIPSFIKRIAPYSFDSCKKLKKVLFENDTKLKTIDRFAFFNSNIESISIPSTVKRICESAFCQCFKIKKVEFEKNSKLISIGQKAFSYSSLEYISIPDEIVRINNSVFLQCCDLSRVEFSANSKLKSIGKKAFFNTNIEKISIPSQLIQIDTKAFSNCKFLQEVNIQNDSELQLIGKRAFFLTKIEKISIPSSILDLQDGFLSGTENLKTVNIDSKNSRFLNYQYKYILGKSDFKNDVYDVILSASSEIETTTVFPYIKHIAGYAFDKCEKLSNVDFSMNENLYSIENHSFSSTALKKVTIPSRIEKIGKESFALCSSLQKVEFESNSKLKSIESYAFAWSSLIEVLIPPNVGKIRNSTFYSCYRLKKVEFADDSKLNAICKNAFASSAIERLLVPASVTEIGSGAFYNCECLKNVIFPPDSKLRTISNRAFSDSSIKCISIPKSATEICELAFFNCMKLEIIEILNRRIIKEFNIDYFSIKYSNKEIIIMITN